MKTAKFIVLSLMVVSLSCAVVMPVRRVLAADAGNSAQIERAWEILATIAEEGTDEQKYTLADRLSNLQDLRALGLLTTMLDEALVKAPKASGPVVSSDDPLSTMLAGSADREKNVGKMVLITLARFPHDLTVPIIKDYLKRLPSNDTQARVQVMSELLNMGDYSHFKELESLMREPRDVDGMWYSTNGGTLFALAKAGSMQAKKSFMNWYSSARKGPPESVVFPLTYLARMNDKYALQRLEAEYKKLKNDPFMKGQVLSDLAMAGDKGFLKEIHDYLLQEDVRPSSKYFVLMGLVSSCADVSNIPIFEKLLKDKDPEIQDIAVGQLFSAGSYDAITPMLEDWLDGDDMERKLDAAYMLTLMGEGTHLDVIADEFDNEDYKTTIRAAVYYIKLTYKDAL